MVAWDPREICSDDAVFRPELRGHRECLRKSMKAKPLGGFTKLDVLILVGTLVLLAFWLVYAQRGGRFGRPRGAARINCTSNLKQVGLGFRMWSNDHGEQFPWQSPAADGGTKEFAHLPYAALHYVVASNEFNSPKILTCPTDTNRIRTNVWEAPLHLSLSYFAGLNADETQPATMLAGDRNISTNGSIMVGLLTVQDTRQLQFTKDIHNQCGNIGMSDGSVAQLASDRARIVADGELQAITNQPIRLVIP